MRVVSTKISIGSFDFDFVHSLEIESSWENLTDKAAIKMPSKVGLDKDKLKNQIKKGDSVEISIGYDGNLSRVFSGYVSFIKPSTPIEIECQDEMWKLKQININSYFRGGNLREFIQEIFPELIVDSFDIKLAPIHFVDVNGAKVLDTLKSDYRLFSFFREGKLVVGKQYDSNYARKHTFRLDYNMVEDDLVFKSKDDVVISVKAISTKPDGKKITVELGEKGGDTTTLNFFNLSEEDLTKAAQIEIERLKYDGFRGDFEAFGEPIVRHGDIVRLIHAEESEKTGEYWVDSVETTTGIGGIRQKIKLGARA